MFKTLLGKSNFLCILFFLELTDLVIYYFLAFLDFSNFILSFSYLLTINILLTSHLFIQLLLLLQLILSLNILLLKFRNEIILQLNLLESMKVLSIGLGSLNAVLFLLLFQCTDRLFHFILLLP